MALTRRSFLQLGGAVLAVSQLYRLYRHYRSSGPAHVVLLYQEGGVDGLSMVVPHGDPVYYAARPGLAVPRSRVIDLDGYSGLHPALAALLPFWADGCLAVLPAVGLAGRTRSHFAARAALTRVIRTAFTSPASFSPRPGGDDQLGAHLRQLAVSIHNGTAPKVAVVRIAGWDTHWGQGAEDGCLAARLRVLAGALVGFAVRLGRRFDDVAVLTLSEFGRTTAQNGIGGTDHGGATAMLMLGGRVEGGRVLGGRPALDPTPGAGLPIGTDLRRVLAELLGARPSPSGIIHN